jgi:hypothetical protein
MRTRVFLYVSVSMLQVTTIVAIAMLWVHLSHLRRYDGPLLFELWSTHGVHVFDVGVLAIELMLATLLTGTLIAGFARGR